MPGASSRHFKWGWSCTSWLSTLGLSNGQQGSRGTNPAMSVQASLVLVLKCLRVVGIKVWAISWSFEFSLLIFTSPCQMIYFLNAGRLGPTVCLFLGHLFPKRGDKLQLFRYLSCVLSGRREVMAPFPAQWHLVPSSLGSPLDMGCLVSNLLLSALCQSKRGEDSNSVLIVVMALAVSLMPSREDRDLAVPGSLRYRWVLPLLELAPAWHAVEQHFLIIWWWASFFFPCPIWHIC